jgi:hypothetical protein
VLNSGDEGAAPMTAEKDNATRPKAGGVLGNFIRSIRRNFWIDPSVVIETNLVSRGLNMFQFRTQADV